MPSLTDVSVTRVSEGKKGKMGFQVNSEDVWYNYFSGKNKFSGVVMPKVSEGQIVSSMEWKVDPKWGNQLTSLELSDFEPPAPTYERVVKAHSNDTKNRQIGMERSVMISYAKDVACAMIDKNGEFAADELHMAMTMILDAGERAYKTAREFDSLPEPPLRPNSENPPIATKKDEDLPF